MDIKKRDKIIEISILIFGLCLIIFVAVIVLNQAKKVATDLPIIGSYCINKDNMQNIEKLNLTYIKDKEWNCSKCHNNENICYFDGLSMMS